MEKINSGLSNGEFSEKIAPAGGRKSARMWRVREICIGFFFEKDIYIFFCIYFDVYQRLFRYGYQSE